MTGSDPGPTRDLGSDRRTRGNDRLRGRHNSAKGGSTTRTGPAVLTQPVYLLGLLCDGGVWAVSILALAILPLFVVQPILAGSLALTVVLARVFLGHRFRRIDAAAIAIVIAALVAITSASGPPTRTPPTDAFTRGMIVGLGLTLIAGFLLYRGRGFTALAIASGVAFSGAALCARALHLHAWVDALTHPFVWALFGLGMLGIFEYARSLERGEVRSVTALMWSADVVLPAVIGILVLGDTVRNCWELPVLIAIVALTSACIVLASSQAPYHPVRAPSS